MHKIEKSKENVQKCLCLQCPSYSQSCQIKNTVGTSYKLMTEVDKIKHLELMFCAFEKSRCINESKGCLCKQCEIYQEYNLRHCGYCLKTGGTD